MKRSQQADGSLIEGYEPPQERLVPWWQDSDKLLAAVVRRAKESNELAEKLIDAATDLASDDKKLRGRMQKRIAADGMGQRKGPAENDVWCMCVASAYDVLMSREDAPTKQRIRESIGDLYPGKQGPRSAKQIERMVKRGKEILDSLERDTKNK